MTDQLKTSVMSQNFASDDAQKRDILTSRAISHEEAQEAARRLIAGAFGRDDLLPRFSIPARPDEDDDLVMMAYIKQQAAHHA